MKNKPDSLNRLPHSRFAGIRYERRGSSRLSAYVPVFVYGHSAGESPFCEEAYSTVVNDRGALLTMTTGVSAGDRLILTNKVTQVERECRVVRDGYREGLNVQVAVEFVAPAPKFWCITSGLQRTFPAILIDSRRNTR